MEINSREIEERVAATNRNAEALTDMLYAQSVVSGAENAIVREVLYPKYQSRENYDHCRNTAAAEVGFTYAGYGGLPSVTFTSLGAARVFYNSLQCYKGANVGPGSVVTLAIPYVTYGFQLEGWMQWAKDHNLEETLVCFWFFSPI